MKRINNFQLFKNQLTKGLGLFLIMLMLFNSCEKNKDIEPGENTNGMPENTWTTLTDTAFLGGVSAFAIRSALKVAGYPQFNELIAFPISVYKLSYHTVYEGDTITASGVISFPTDTSISRPVMLVGNGLIFDNDDAPSAFRMPDRFTGFEFIATAGYVTLIPDMIGFGDSRMYLFPIHNYEYASKPTVDFYHAAQEFLSTKNISTTQHLFLTGYSQGAYTALSVLKYAESHPETNLTFTATSIGAGGFNLEYVLDYSVEINSYSAPSHLALLTSSYNIVYGWKRELNYFFQDKYASAIPVLLNGNYSRPEIDAFLPSTFDSLLNPNFYEKLKNKTDTDFINAVKLNSIHNWAPQSPLKIFHSLGDERIPYTESEQTVNTMQSLGSTSVEFVLLDSATHVNAAFPFIEQTFEWFASLKNN